MAKVLTPQFFNRPTLVVAKDLLGKFLVRELPRQSARHPASHKATRGKQVAIMVTEVEAYDGPRDKASHASRGLTMRNAPMWGEAGIFYVYFTYGMHWMLNIVTGKNGYPAAILIRAGVVQSNVKGQMSNVINGPARLTEYLKIDKKINGLPANKKTGLWFEDSGVRIKKSQIVSGKRIGVEYAGAWAKKKYNFGLRF